MQSSSVWISWVLFTESTPSRSRLVTATYLEIAIAACLWVISTGSVTLLARFCTDQADFLTASTSSVVSLCFDCGISSRCVQQSRQNVLCTFLVLPRWSARLFSCLGWHTSLVSTFQARGLYELHGASRSSERLRRTTRITWTLWVRLEECQLALASARLCRALSPLLQHRQVFGVRGVETSVSSLEITVVWQNVVPAHPNEEFL